MFVRRLTRNDFQEIQDIITEAFVDDKFFDWLMPKRHIYPEDVRRYQMIRLRSRIVGQGQHGIVVMTEEGDPDWSGKPEIAGFGFFVRSGDDEAGKKWMVDPILNKLERQLLSWESWYVTTFFDRASEPLRFKEYEELGHDGLYAPLGASWNLGLLAVSPHHQRRGVGGKLLKYIQTIANEENVPVSLEASEVGRELYLKCGFKIINEIEYTKGLWDIDMVWEPEHLKGKFLEETEEGKFKIKKRSN